MIEYVIGGAIGVAVGALVGIIMGYIIRKKSAEKRIGSAEQQARKLLEDAMHNAESKRKEMMLEAK